LARFESVIPEKAGIQSWHYGAAGISNGETWIPAFAGMTGMTGMTARTSALVQILLKPYKHLPDLFRLAQVFDGIGHGAFVA